jgi:hypothetical protein
MKMSTKVIQRLVRRGCPRCHGDLFLDREQIDYACLQCGHRVEIEDVAPVHHVAAGALVQPLPAKVGLLQEVTRGRAA